MKYEALLAEIDAMAFFAHQSGELGEPLSTEAVMQRRDIIREELVKLYQESGQVDGQNSRPAPGRP